MREEQNLVELSGYLQKEVELSHEYKGELFYKTELVVKRDSGQVDIIPLIIPEVMIEGLSAEQYLNILGQFRSYNKNDGEKSKLVLYTFVQDIEVIEDIHIPERDTNKIQLEGYLCKAPIYRVTPRGREISDVLLAVNRSSGRADYIPCITWGRNALRMSKMAVGQKVKFLGRIQSREYEKAMGDGEKTVKKAYEVSVCKVSEQGE